MRPLFDLTTVAVWASVRIGMVAIPLVEKALVLALQFVFEDHPLNTDVVFLKALGRSQICGMQLCVMRQLTGADVARIERLARLLFGRPMALQKLASTVGQRH